MILIGIVERIPSTCLGHTIKRLECKPPSNGSVGASSVSPRGETQKNPFKTEFLRNREKYEVAFECKTSHTPLPTFGFRKW